MSKQTPPQWAVPPTKRVSLLCYKDGSVVDTVVVSDALSFSLGRNSDMVDYVLLHESVSRYHAVIAQDREGNVCIMDVGSAQGTFVNGVKLMPNKPRKLNDGDELRFASSTRVYRVEIQGPAVVTTTTTMTKPTAVTTETTPTVTADEGDSSSEDDSDEDNGDGSAMLKGFGKQSAKQTITAQAHAENVRQPTVTTAGTKRKAAITFGAITGEKMPSTATAPTTVVTVTGPQPGAPRKSVDVDSGSDSNDSESDVDDDAVPAKVDDESHMEQLIEYARNIALPVSHEIKLQPHSKTVTTIACDRSGARLLTGSNDYNVRLFDFAGMDRNHRAFKTVTPKEDHVVLALSFSPTGDRFVVATGSAQPMVYDRDGNWLMTCVKGDPYIMDMYHTNGHNALVTGAQWHPTAANTIITCGNDGTVRVWDLLNPKTTFDKEICNKQVVRVKNAGGTRLPVTACAYSPAGKHIVVGGEDGSLHYWNVRTTATYPPQPDRLIREAHGDAITSITFQPLQSQSTSGPIIFATRSHDNTIKLWDLLNFKHPLSIITDVVTLGATTNLAFSPDGTYFVAGTGVRRAGAGKHSKTSSGPIVKPSSGRHTSAYSDDSASDGDGDGKSDAVSSTPANHGCLKVFNMSSLLSSDGGLCNDVAVYSIDVCVGDSVVSCNWHPITKQIVVGCGDGSIHVFYDPTITVKGAMLSAARAPARRGVGDFIMDFSTAVFNPDVRPAIEERLSKRQRRELEAKQHAVRTKKPTLPDLAAQKKTSGSTFTQFLMQSKITETTNIRVQDPREQLLKFAEQAKNESNWISQAYASTQPTAQLAESTLEADVEAEAALTARKAGESVDGTDTEPKRRQ